MNIPASYHKKLCARHHTTLFIACFFYLPFIANAQLYNFSNFSVESGLVQSQPMDIAQDNTGNLWIATLGGVSRYNGKEFSNYTQADGLLSHLVYKVFPASNGLMFLGTENGLQSYDGKKFSSIVLPASAKSQIVLDICETGEKEIFVMTAVGELISITHKTIVSPLDGNIVVTAIATDKNNSLYAAIFQKGIFRYKDHRWMQHIEADRYGKNIPVYKISFDDSDGMWLMATKALYKYSNGLVDKIVSDSSIPATFISIENDPNGNTWLGTTKGAYKITPWRQIRHMGSKAGLADISVNEITKDWEGNLWFASDGEGLYKLTNSAFYIFNKTSGLSGNVVMGIAGDENGDTWIGTSDGGLVKHVNGNFKKIIIPSKSPETQKINALFADSKNQLWVGSLGGGVWKKNRGGIWQEILTDQGASLADATGVFESSDKTIWVTAVSGLYYNKHDALYKIKDISRACFSVFDAGDGSVLTGTTQGLWRVYNNKTAALAYLPGVTLTTVTCFTNWGEYLLVGTANQGLLFWDRKRNTILRCSTANGLASDFIFSVFASGNIIYAGTGHGVSKISVSEKSGQFKVSNFSSTNAIYGPECNLNAVYKKADGSLMFGTTKGIIVLNATQHEGPETKHPLIFLHSVKLFSRKIVDKNGKDTMVAWNPIPRNLALTYKQNHLTFEFTGIWLTNPAGIQYRYMLEGVDSVYSEPAATPSVIYSRLSPGRYRFKAIAITDNGVQSSNAIDFAFEIRPAFFQSLWFKALVIMVLMVLGAFLQHTRSKIKTRKAESIRKIRLDEQQKMQERISEDLHDDLGNKITRIAVLTDVLNNKLQEEEQDKRKIVIQIKENAQSLYLGTKDIIWSLNPGYGNLYDMADRCYQFGQYLFSDTDIEFNMEGQNDEYRKIIIPLLINRNFMMIVKEALNNILKHANATKVDLAINLENPGQLICHISDNGSGIDQSHVKNGHGLENMKKRAERINGDFQIRNNFPSGTVIEFSCRIPPKEG